MMDALPRPGSVSANDIASQTDGWIGALDAVSRQVAAIRRRWEATSWSHVVIAGCGSPLFLADTARHLLYSVGRVGVPITVTPADELRRDAGLLVPSPHDSLLVVISRSGATSEVLEAIAAFRQAGGREVWAVTCRSESPLAECADLALAFDEGFEKSVAQTRSFSSMLVAVGALAATIGGDDLVDAADLPRIGTDVIDVSRRRVDSIDLRDQIDRIDFVGSGEHYGLAREAMLKMSEMALTSSAAYRVLEYRHGPISMTDATSLLVGILGPRDDVRERAVLDDVARLGGGVLAIDGADLPPAIAALPTWALPVLKMPALQMIAHRRAMLLGLDPDTPRHLDAVVDLATRSSVPTDPSTTRARETT